MSEPQQTNIDKLFWDLKSEDKNVRTNAVEELGKLPESNDKIVWSLINAARWDKDPAVRRLAKNALRIPAHKTIFEQIEQKEHIKLSLQGGAGSGWKSDVAALSVSLTFGTGFWMVTGWVVTVIRGGIAIPWSDNARFLVLTLFIPGWIGAYVIAKLLEQLFKVIGASTQNIADEIIVVSPHLTVVK